MKESKVINSSDLNGYFTADHLISLGYKYQRGIAVPYEYGSSFDDENDRYGWIDVCLEQRFNINAPEGQKPIEHGETVCIVLDK